MRVNPRAVCHASISSNRRIVAMPPTLQTFRPSDLQTPSSARPSDLPTFRPSDAFSPPDLQTFKRFLRQTFRPSDFQTFRRLFPSRPSDLQTFRRLSPQTNLNPCGHTNHHATKIHD